MTLDATGRSDQSVSTRRDAVPFRRIGTLSSTKRDPATSDTAYFIKASGTDVLQFGEREYFLWRLLDGTNSLADIQGKFRERFGATLTPQQFDSFVDQLVDCGAVEAHQAGETALSEPEPEPVMPAPLDRLEAELPRDQARVRPSRRLCDPTRALRLLESICGPLRFFRWLLLPALVGVVVGCVLDASAIATDLAALRPGPALGFVALALLVTGIVPPLSQAVAATFLGYATPGCRIAFRWRIVPRLVFDDVAWRAIAWRHVLGVVAAPCLARLVLFAAGTGIWLAARPSRGWPADLALIIGLVGLVSFLISAAPFLPSQGRRWLATVFGGRDPWTVGAGYRLHAVVLSGLWFEAVIGTLLVAACAALPLLDPGWYDPSFGRFIQSAVLPLLAMTPVATRLWISGMVSSHGALQPTYDYGGRYDGDGPQALDPAGYVREPGPRQSRMLVDAAVAPRRRQVAERWPSTKSIIIWAVILGVTEAIAFVSYPYEAGGYFTILPYNSSQLNARVAGELTEVLVNEGDEVKPGQIVGILSDWQEKYNLAVSKAQLQNAEANLQHLLETPLPDDVELAHKQYDAAMARLPYDRAQFERYAALVTNDTVSRANYDQVLSQYQQDQAAADVARANYDQVRSGPTPAQIEAARAMVRQYTATVAFNEDELQRTRIRATSAGVVVTPNPLLLRGKWFTQGSLVFTVENHREVQADVQVPETDIDNVRLGGPVRLRLWGSPEVTVIGESIAIAPDAQTPTSANPQTPQSGTSNVVRVRVDVPNPDGVLHPNTDGYAKMAGLHMPTWRAFGQMMERFFLVEIWSWVP